MAEQELLSPWLRKAMNKLSRLSPSAFLELEKLKLAAAKGALTQKKKQKTTTQGISVRTESSVVF